MTSARLLSAQDRPARPWKNGGGVTRDVAVFPEGAGDEDFLWRASLATIAAPGPFSPFPGVDRAFLLVEGALRIRIGDGDEHHLHGGASAPLLFGGEEAVMAAPVEGPCLALNIMTRRGKASARITAWDRVRPTSADTLLLIAPTATIVRCGPQDFPLSDGDAVLIDGPTDAMLAIDGPVIAAEIFGVQLVQ